MDVRVLGTTTIWAGGDAVEVRRTSERALLVRLAMAGRAAVSDARLATDLWGDEEAHRGSERLRVLASRLRGALGPHAASLARTPAGYRLDAEVPDLRTVTALSGRLHAELRAGDHTSARATAIEALTQWRGPALVDLRAIPFASAEAVRLDEWNRDLTVARLQAEIVLGGGAEHIAELTAMTREHHLHEPIAGLLAQALYRSGRQAEALARLAELRGALAEELGVDPTPATVDLEMRLLRQDPALSAVPAATPAPGPARPALMAAPATSFVGRADELSELLDHLARPGVVTLVGEPGSGKSRLAAEAATAVQSGGRAIRVLELATIRREAPPGSDTVTTALARTVGLGAVGADADPLPTIAAALGTSLLVVDNAEHLIDEVAALVHELGRLAPELTILVTSQRPLLVIGEIRQRVRPLDPAAAMTLFRQRAAVHAKSVTSDRDVAAICAAVDGLPLGIELAAGLTRTLTPRQLAERMTDRLRLLVGGRRDGTGRHGSLRAALNWSHELLDERERVVLRRLAVLGGGFDLETAERVVPGGEIEPGDVSPALTDLVDRSVLTVSVDPEGPRFTLLETVRDYALEQLERAGETASVRARTLTSAPPVVEEDDQRDAVVTRLRRGESCARPVLRSG